MSDLTRLTKDLIAFTYRDDTPALPVAIREFIERITFADAEEVLSSLHAVLADDWMAMPVWARNLAYRLACLQVPDNSDLLREAAADLLCFGPDWDEVAEELKRRAEQLES